ncbi:hypothetical protein Vretimale_12567 [Volvox reticuliferus]|uniref:Uncharacterized protein n=1 Tax=Volvox reticuliferus TaxID=1737510 RepID=A0A8J4FQ82_9CHLO|nr:hypothetical protein Vretifemale_9184 [Volvox reticuliferus]GIM08550.1 hypothetical protein Vretimale_12567 [Volvox reticuliferus]
MSKLSKPLLVLNLTCESMFIIRSRLAAQNVSTEKGRGIITAIVDYICSQNSLNEMFNPQEPLSRSALHKLMEQAVNRGSMQITGASMDKLFELTVTMFKYQVVRSWKLEQLVEITTRHLSGVVNILNVYQCSTSTIGMVNNAQSRVKATFDQAVGVGELHRIRQTLLQVFQGHRIKASNLLQTNAQNSDGSFVLASPRGDRVGSIHLYDDIGNLVDKDRQPIDQYWPQETLVLNQEVPLGSNLFSKDTDGSRAQVPSATVHVDVHIVLPAVVPIIDVLHASPNAASEFD